MEAGPADHHHRALGSRRLDRPGQCASPPPKSKRRSARRLWSSTNPAPRDRSAPRTRSRRRKTATPGRPAPPRTSAPMLSAACSTPRFPIGGFISASSTSRCSASIRSTPYKIAQDVVNAMKAKPDQVSVATAGINSSGHAAIEAFTRALKLTYKHVTYDGGNPAVIATVVRRDRNDDPACGRAGQHDPRQAPQSARGPLRQAARTRRLWHHPADHGFDVPASSPTPITSASSCTRTCRHRCCQTLDMVWKDVIMQVGGAEEIRPSNGAHSRPSHGDAAAQGCDAGNPVHRLAIARRRQVESRAGHGRDPEALTQAFDR